MTDSCIRLILDVRKTNMPVTVKAKRGDTGRRLQIALSDGGVPYPIGDDCIAVFTGKKPDKTTLFSPCAIENNTVTYVFTEQTCAAVGKLPAEIRLYGRDNKLLTSASFLIEVHDTLWHEEDIPSTGEMDALDALITRTAALKAEVEQMLEDLENGDFVPGGSGSGEKGEDGATFIPSVDAAGNLSWTNDGGLANPETVNIKGEAGNGIVSVTRTSGNGAAGTVDTYTITFTDGSTKTFTVRHGADGRNGTTPQKGTDYFTAADRAQMVSDVIAALPVYNGEAVNE